LGFGDEAMTICIGLFGTCDNNRWRDSFMAKYTELGIEFFNPMVDDWHPGMVPLEAQHLANDEIILFPILGWSYGEGSLSELGFGPLKAMRQNKNRSFVFFIEVSLHERLTDPDRCKASLRGRKLILGHLTELDAPNIYIMDSLEQMLETSTKLHEVHTILKTLKSVQTA
jgi:hypothetical protein